MKKEVEQNMKTKQTQKDARRLDWRIHSLNREMMALLEESGGEFTPEVEALEARLVEKAEALGELGAAMKVYARQMQEVVAAESKRLRESRDYYRRVEGVAERFCRIAAREMGVDKYEAGTFRVSLRTPPVRLVGGPAVGSDGWADGGDESLGLVGRGLGRLGVKPDRNAILAEVKKGAEVLDYAAERPAEKTVVVK